MARVSVCIGAIDALTRTTRTHPQLFVMVLFPCVANVFVAWIYDNILMKGEVGASVEPCKDRTVDNQP